MKNLMSVLACLALGLTIIPSVLVFTGGMDKSIHKHLMLAGTLMWFIAAPVWFRESRKADEK